MENPRNKLRTYQLIIEVRTGENNVLQSALVLPKIIHIIVKFVGSIKYLQSIQPDTLEYDDDGICHGINWKITLSINRGLGLYYEKPEIDELKQKLINQFEDLTFHVFLNETITCQFTTQDDNNSNNF